MFTRLHLENWKNFTNVEVALQRRAFIVGPNAAGKSNLLDAMRFLRDIAEPQGGLQRAIAARQSISQIRSLHARRHPAVVVEAELELASESWTYRLALTQDNNRVPKVEREIVLKNGESVLERPDRDDHHDPNRLTQTHLEQVNANKDFRAVAEFLAGVRYLHLVPQLIREPDRSVGKRRDPYGGDFLEQILTVPVKTRDSRLRRITEALRVAVPQLKELKLERDVRGVPHLRGLYEHWRPNAGWQTEEQFSDGTLRLLGLLWVLLDGTAPVLLEEPELSLHAGVIRYLPQILTRLARKSGRQVLLTTHSADLLMDPGIDLNEVLVLTPSSEGTLVEVASSKNDIRALVTAGMSVAEAVVPRTAPPNAAQLSLFGQ
ncbi:MAG TPA: AAA family ATPase [Polyangiales bacterium]|nr:AAA family ATPase [Polyangiales bacterium]